MSHEEEYESSPAIKYADDLVAEHDNTRDGKPYFPSIEQQEWLQNLDKSETHFIGAMLSEQRAKASNHLFKQNVVCLALGVAMGIGGIFVANKIMAPHQSEKPAVVAAVPKAKL